MATSGVVLRPLMDDSAFPSLSVHGRDLCLPDEILIYLAFENSMVPLRVFSSDTVAHVKFKIQTCKGLNVRQQRLVCGGRELARNNSLVKDYGLTDGNILHLMVRLSHLQSVTVKTVEGKNYVYKLQRSSSIRELKHLISKEKENIELDDQELIFKGKQLDDQETVEGLALQNDLTVHLFLKKNAKVQAKHIGETLEVSVDATIPVKDPVWTDPDSSTVVSPWPSTLLSAKPNGYHDGFLDYRMPLPNPLPRKECLLEPLTASSKHKLSPTFQKMIKEVREGLELGQSPVCSMEGSGGAYFMKDSSGSLTIGVFKPIDEEPMAVNNPRGLPISINGEGLKKGTRVGEGAYREVASYILDHPFTGPRSLFNDELGFAGVPPTMMIKCSHNAFYFSEDSDRLFQRPKMGSLQQFVKSESNCEDMGPAAFPVEEVHKIAVLDIRLANTDRHGGNILVCRDSTQSSLQLVPIDHGYCLPESFEDCTFEWMNWPQAEQPFSPKFLKYIESLDVEKDIALLKFHGWTLSDECARVFRISTMLLKKGAAAGLSPYDIALIMCRESLNKPSVIENIVEEALDSVLPESSEATFLESVSQIMDRYLHV
eukprot:TRINITY_DN28891_c0_g1_i1.p1 TRINITY_DN28891_c0_g1~~TRINITY_DN28891_c0_g1_i1.p1  ORF type:complete len:599 (-),score=111.93 TRINITY_DN28891_c0_g1_i1:306-2102(-)